jgi:phage gp29-like protein
MFRWFRRPNSAPSISPNQAAQAAGWDLPPVPGGTSTDRLLGVASAFDDLDRSLGVESFEGFRRTMTRGVRPSKNDPIVDLPVSASRTWDARAIQQALNEHHLGQFANSAHLVEAMLSDARVSHSINSRTKGVLKRKPYFLPNKRAKDQKLAKYIADELQELYYEILPLEVQEQLWCWAPMMGWSLFNMVWNSGQEDLYLPTLRFWHPSYTFFLNAANLEDRKLQAITMGGGNADKGLVPIESGDPEWFHFAPYGEYRGWTRGAVRQVGIPWYVRNLSMRDWSRCSEVHGLPQRIVKVPANALEEDKARLFRKLVRLASEATFILPTAGDGSGFSVELLEPKNTKSWEVFQMLGQRCDSDIMLAIKGTQLLSALGDAAGKSSSMAASKTTREEDGDYSDSDALKFCASARRNIFAPICKYNHENSEDCVPLFSLSDEPPADKQANAKAWLDVSAAMVNFSSVGADVDVEKVGEEFEIPFTSDELDPPEVETEPQMQSRNALKAKLHARRQQHDAHQRYADAVVTASVEHASKAISEHLTSVRQAVEKSTTPDDLRKNLKRLARTIKHGSLETLTKNARDMSYLAGRAAQKENEK